MEGDARLAKRAGEIFGCDRTEFEAGRRDTGNSSLVKIDNRIRKSADPRYDRDRAVSQGAKLGQAARFEAGRHHQGIRTGLNEMGASLVIADLNRYPSRICRSDRLIADLEICISTPKQG